MVLLHEKLELVPAATLLKERGIVFGSSVVIRPYWKSSYPQAVAEALKTVLVREISFDKLALLGYSDWYPIEHFSLAETVAPSKPIQSPAPFKTTIFEVGDKVMVTKKYLGGYKNTEAGKRCAAAYTNKILTCIELDRPNTDPCGGLFRAMDVPGIPTYWLPFKGLIHA